MTRQELIDHCLTYPGAYEDYSFKITPDCTKEARMVEDGRISYV